MIYTISVRGKDPRVPILLFLARQYGHIPVASIDSVFGFVESSSLYGGRPFVRPEMTDHDVQQMYHAGIGLRIPFSNLYVEREEYEANKKLLLKYHRKGNSVITTNDDLARWIREDFPSYQIEASVIKNIKTHDEIQQALEIYDTVVLPMVINQDMKFLEQVENKEHVTLFANAGCALTCPSKICYPSISKMNKFNGAKFMCSQDIKHRDMIGVIDFDLQALSDLGFERFKVLRSRASGVTGY